MIHKLNYWKRHTLSNTQYSTIFLIFALAFDDGSKVSERLQAIN